MAHDPQVRALMPGMSESAKNTLTFAWCVAVFACAAFGLFILSGEITL